MSVLKRLLFKSRFSAMERATIDAFSRTRFFSGLDKKALAALHPYVHKRRYKPQEVVFFRHDPALALYLLRQGSVQAFFPQAQAKEPLQAFRAGDVLGYEALLPNRQRLFDAIASEESELWVIAHADIRSLMAHDARFATQLFERLAHRLNHTLTELCQAYENEVGFFRLEQSLKV